MHLRTTWFTSRASKDNHAIALVFCFNSRLEGQGPVHLRTTWLHQPGQQGQPCNCIAGLAGPAGEARLFSDAPVFGPRPAVETKRKCNCMIVLAGPAGENSLISDAPVLGPRRVIERENQWSLAPSRLLKQKTNAIAWLCLLARLVKPNCSQMHRSSAPAGCRNRKPMQLHD